MKLWADIIIEWTNCLDILETSISDLQELDDGKFYQKLINSFSWKGAKDGLDTKAIITTFLQDEYPEFKFNYNELEDTGRIYIASLFLLHVCQEPLFYQPMCVKLQHETQLKIKAFLEMIIPCGRDVNKEKLREIITELEGNIPQTPMTPKTRGLKDFLDSPAVRSARIHKLLSEKNRVLRKLKTDLEVERFEKSDLLEDLQIQQGKVQALEKKLQEKIGEIKALQEEKMRLNTPQSCKKNKDTIDLERYYKREIDHLEDQLMQKQYEVDRVEVANDTLTKRLTSMEKQCKFFKEKFENYEKDLENAQIQGELKDKELISLRMINEELRMHLQELSKTAMEERSFEIDGIAPLHSPLTSLNNSEALSSVIEIQLQEAKEESASLKSQVDILNKKLKSVSQNYENTTQLLKEKTQILQDTETKSNDTINKLTKEIESLKKGNESLINENKSLKNVCTSLEKTILEVKESKDVLTAEINSLKENVERLEESLNNVTTHNIKINTELTEAKSQVDEKRKYIDALTNQNNVYKSAAELYNKNLKEIILHNSEVDFTEVDNLNDKTTIELIKHFRTLLDNFSKKYSSKETELRSLNKLIKETNSKVQDFQSQIFELREKDNQNITKISQLKETIDQNVEQIDKLTTTIEQYSKEILRLKQIELEKQNLEKDLHICKEEIKKKVSLLQTSEICMQTLKTDIRTLVKEFHMIKKHMSKQLIDCQKQNKETGKNIINIYGKLYSNYTKEQLHKSNLERELSDCKKELKDSKNLNITLENNSIKDKQIINDLKIELSNTKDKFIESVEQLTKLEKIKKKLEEEQENLQSENEKILISSNKTNSELKLSQQEICSISDQLKRKDEKIENLIAEITSLKSEEEQILKLQMDKESELKNSMKELEMKLLEKQHCIDQLNMEMKLKKETLELVQNKLEKFTKEAVASEMKMKEVIINLQEVRTNQEAVLVTQEKALKEKCLQIEQLEKEFGEAKGTLCKQLETEKLLSQNLQSANSELQIQSYKQMKMIEELQEMLKKEKDELNKNEEYLQAQDVKNLQIVELCKLLRNSINDLKLIITENGLKNEDYYIDDVSNKSPAANNDETESISNTIETSVNEIQASRKLILHLININADLNEALQNQKEIVNSYITKREKYMKELNNIIEHKDALRNSLQSIEKSREELDMSLKELREKWIKLLTKLYNIFTMNKSICDEFKYIEDRKSYFENMLFTQYTDYYQNFKPLHTILCQKLVCTEHRLKDSYLDTIENEQMLSTSSDIFCEEKVVIEAELQKNILLQRNTIKCHHEIDDFSNFVASFENNFKSDRTKFKSETEKKLQSEIDQLIEDKNNLESKLDCALMKNVKLENELAELFKIRRETNDLKKELAQLKGENLKLQEERNELIERPKKEDVDNQLKDVHDKYKLKLNEIKQNMKAAYNEQIVKLNKEQEQWVQESLESLQKRMELQCRKQADELSKYKAHVATMSSQIWNVGEKLLSERQEKEKLQTELNKLKAKYQNLDDNVISATEHKKYEKTDILDENKDVLHKIAIIQEKTTTYERRCSIRSIQTMGNAFNAEDEEEVFDNTYLADMKDENSSIIDVDRLSILKKRNALCKPHLKSSYPAEMQFHPLPFSEEEIKTGSVGDEMFNDSLSQSLLPEQKAKKRDKTQTSYKKPGPPTPSKNGGRLSLQGNELKSPNSRILRERNKDRATTTPRTLRSLFSSKRHDETVVVTPRGRRRSSIFRKYRGINDR